MARFARRSHGLLFGCLVLLGLAGGGLPLPPGDAAATIVVTSLADPGAGGCDVAECTLREAIAAAQAGDTITFAPTLFATGRGTITLMADSREGLVIGKDLTLVGPGRRLLVISGNKTSRVFTIATGVVVTIQKVTVR